MPEISLSDVETIARAAGLTIAVEDLLDVMYRLNILISGIEQLDFPDLDLDNIDPLPFKFPD